LHSLPDIVRVFKSKGIRWKGHVVDKGEMGKTNKIIFGNPEQTISLRDLSTDERIIKKLCGLDLLAQDTVQWRVLVKTMNLRVL
jgi:hypothetical protein